MVRGMKQTEQLANYMNLLAAMERALKSATIPIIITEGALLGYMSGSGISLQIVFGLVGLLVVVLALVPATRRYYGIGRWAATRP